MAMMKRNRYYDENLENNIFLKKFKEDFAELFDKTVSEDWLIIVPQSNSLPRNLKLRPEDVSRHVIITLEKDEFRSLVNERVEITADNVINVYDNQGIVEASRSILFSEVFYDDGLRKYKVICVDGYLGQDEDGLFLSAKTPSSVNTKVSTIATLNDCVKCLYSSQEEEFLRRIELSCSNFDPTKSSIEVLIRSIKERLRSTEEDSEELRLAVETYAMYLVHIPLYNSLQDKFIEENAQINKLIRCKNAFRPFEILNEGEDLCTNIHKSELMRLNEYSTPFEKLECVLRSIRSFGTISSSDEFLHKVVCAVVSAHNIVDWYSQFRYIKDYRFSASLTDGESDYVLTTLEAALQHIVSEENSLDTALKFQSKNEKIVELLNAVLSSNTETIQQLLGIESNERRSHELPSKHHPLCSCTDCSKVEAKKDHYLGINSHEDLFGMTPLHVASLKGDSIVIDDLVKIGADMVAMDFFNRTPLHLASQFGNRNAVLFMLQSSSNPTLNFKDKEERTPLHLAASHGQESIVKAILYIAEHQSFPLEINCRDEFGNTPLHAAALYGYSRIVKLLLDYSADVNAVNKRNQTPSDCTLSNQLSEIINNSSSRQTYEYFKSCSSTTPSPVRGNNAPTEICGTESANSKVDQFFKAIMIGDVDLVYQYLKVNNSKETQRSRFLYQSHCYPICGGCNNCIGSLPELANDKSPTRLSFPPVDVNASNDEGKTGVHVAAQLGHIEIIELLLNFGAGNFPIVTETWETPLHLACRNGHLGAVVALAKDKNNFMLHVDAKDRMGNTALQYCASSGDYEIADKLLSLGASIKATNLSGDSAIEIARRCQDFAMCALFKRAYNGKLIIGPMFSGKSTELIRRLKRYQIAKYRCLNIKYANDTRYEKNGIATHDKIVFEAVSTYKLNDLNEKAQDYDVIGIDEGQFFPDVVEFCETFANKGKTVIVAALDGTFQRKGFLTIMELIPLAESVIKLNAVCMMCYGEGSYTRRKSNDQEVEVIGGSETYMAVCRRCYHVPIQNSFNGNGVISNMI